MNLEAIKFDDDLEMSVFIPEQQDSIRLVLSDELALAGEVMVNDYKEKIVHMLGSSAYFVNIGLHPLFLESGLLEEVNCALRTRLGSIDHRNGMDQAELEKAVQEAIDFTAQYSSYSTVFSSIDPEKDLEKDWLLKQFSITKMNLCRLYVEYYDAIDSKKLTLDFANYGLSITPKIASVPKNFFKTYIRLGEIIKTTY